MFRSREAWVLLLAIGLIVGFTVWAIARFGPQSVRYYRLATDGIEAEASVSSLGLRDDGDYDVTLALGSAGATGATCSLRMSEAWARDREIGSAVDVRYLPAQPDRCLPVGTIAAAKPIFYLAGVVVLLALVSIAIMIAILWSSFRVPRDASGVALTTDLGLDAVTCPRCDGAMAEGYIPGGYGIVWRDRAEPVGLPSVFSGMPGSTFWLSRPRMHAFRCADCQIVLFRYGKP